MNTPVPISIRSKRGLKSKLSMNNLDIPVHKSSLRTYELPEHTICISSDGYRITYRYVQEVIKSQWGGSTVYAEISTSLRPCVVSGRQNTYYSGCVANPRNHDKFMETFRIIHPVMEQLFSR
jgi:hypothetical protein